MNHVIMPHRAFYLIRHGETDWNVRRLITGQKNISLNQKGQSQARSAAEILAHKNIKQIFCSALQRTRQTADIINQHLKTSIVYRDDLIERGWGQDEGKEHPLDTSLSTIEDKDLPAGAESSIKFQTRITTALAHILEHCDGTPLIVAHGGVFVTLIHYFEHQPLHIHNCLPYLFQPPLENTKGWTFQEIKS